MTAPGLSNFLNNDGTPRQGTVQKMQRWILQHGRDNEVEEDDLGDIALKTLLSMLPPSQRKEGEKRLKEELRSLFVERKEDVPEWLLR